MSQIDFKDNPYIAVVAKKHRNLKKKHEKILKIESQVQAGKVLDEEQLILYNSRLTVVKAMNDLKALLIQLEDVAKEEQVCQQSSIPSVTVEQEVVQEPTEESKTTSIVAEETETLSAPIFPSHPVTTELKYEEADLLKILKVFHVVTRYQSITQKNLPEHVDFFGKTLLGQTSIKGFQDTLVASVKSCVNYLDLEEASKREVVRGVTLTDLATLIDQLSLEMVVNTPTQALCQTQQPIEPVSSTVAIETIREEKTILSSVIEKEIVGAPESEIIANGSRQKRNRKNSRNPKIVESNTTTDQSITMIPPTNHSTSSFAIESSVSSKNNMSMIVPPQQLHQEKQLKDPQEDYFEKLLIPRNPIAAAAAKASSNLDINFFPNVNIYPDPYVSSSFLSSLHKNSDEEQVNNSVRQDVDENIINSKRNNSKRTRRNNKPNNEKVEDNSFTTVVSTTINAIPTVVAPMPELISVTPSTSIPSQKSNNISVVVNIPTVTTAQDHSIVQVVAPPAAVATVNIPSALVNPTPIPPIMGVEAALRYLTQPQPQQPQPVVIPSSNPVPLSSNEVIETNENAENLKKKRSRKSRKNNQNVVDESFGETVSNNVVPRKDEVLTRTSTSQQKSSKQHPESDANRNHSGGSTLPQPTVSALPPTEQSKDENLPSNNNNRRNRRQKTPTVAVVGANNSTPLDNNVVISKEHITAEAITVIKKQEPIKPVSFAAAVSNKPVITTSVPTPVVLSTPVIPSNIKNVKKTNIESSSSQNNAHSSNSRGTNNSSIPYKKNFSTDAVPKSNQPNPRTNPRLNHNANNPAAPTRNSNPPRPQSVNKLTNSNNPK